jgi:hypothetical protein
MQSPGTVVDPGQFVAPLAVQAVQELAQGQHPGRPDRVGELVQVPGGQPAGDGLEGGQVVVHRSAGGMRRMCVRVHGGKLSTPPANASTKPTSGDIFREGQQVEHLGLRIGNGPPHRARRRHGAHVPGHRARQAMNPKAPATEAGKQWGPEHPRPPSQATTWGPNTHRTSSLPRTPNHPRPTALGHRVRGLNTLRSGRDLARRSPVYACSGDRGLPPARR